MSNLEYFGMAVSPAVPALIHVAETSKDENRIDAIHLIANCGSRGIAAQPVLEELLLNPNVSVRIAAADALLRTSGEHEAAVKVLVDVLFDSDKQQRLAAVNSIWNAGEAAKGSLHALARAASDKKRAEVAARTRCRQCGAEECQQLNDSRLKVQPSPFS